MNLNIAEQLFVTIEQPTSWATGNTDQFLRNRVVLNIASNNAAGFSAYMYSRDTTNLENTMNPTMVIPTLASETTAANFPADRWGYSLNDTEAGSSTALYNALGNSQSSDTRIAIESSTSSDFSKAVYFGAKASAAKDSGTYENTVVFHVVSGVITEDETVNPTPDSGGSGTNNDVVADVPQQSGGVASIADEGDTKEETSVSKGDVSNSYAEAQGVTTSKKVGDTTTLATGLAVTAGVAAASGLFFIVVAKRRKEEEDEEQEQ
ncbi:MAG: hypothetical protein Q4B65_00280 [Candidatus Saccharibacteria bacterium]|nr:hypothetical protein [Candidatus Saccharibacteria bacterium]